MKNRKNSITMKIVSALEEQDIHIKMIEEDFFYLEEDGIEYEIIVRRKGLRRTPHPKFTFNSDKEPLEKYYEGLDG